MTITEQIRDLCARLNVSIAELARRTGQSAQCLNGKLKRGSFTVAEIDDIAEAVGAKFERRFVLVNGEKGVGAEGGL